MAGIWRRERILIWGKTRPELSQTYGELVCTGGLLASTKELIRLYPIPLRYLDDERIFRKYQWVEADICKSTRDYRPESYRIEFNSISTGEIISTTDGSWDERADWILTKSNLVQSLEELQELQVLEKKSLGIITPKEVLDVTCSPFSLNEKREWKERYDLITRQADLPFMEEEKRSVKPIPPPDFRFRITFSCNDDRCNGSHTFSVLDWEVDALYNKLKNAGDQPRVAAEKVLDKLRQIASAKNDFRFFLGNIANHPLTFTIVGLWYPKKEKTLNYRMPLLANLK